MKRLIALLATVVGLSMVPAVYAEATPASSPDPAPSVAVTDTRMALRDLWVEHVFWTRDYAVANQQGEKAAAAVAADEVVANAKAIAASIAPLYGDAGADQLLTLLAGHWGAVKQYSDATVASNSADQNAAQKALTDNAAALADFLSTANPYLPRDTLFSLLVAHGGHHVSQINELKAGDYAAEAKTWHAMRKHILAISDALTKALAKQFPEKF
ncbi:MAG TPA: hypothetical protein VL027_00845 [Spongiibacteraceae bacterium]|jgi:hypothetical protein|nr:hypothetical protein [Spongiibacteraceae bacterium]HUH36470.1 hypothetical protein [Spongiibacteraceae bacterium]